MRDGSHLDQTRGLPDLILEVWDELGRSAVGERELRAIRSRIKKKLGPKMVESPAAIARVLADAGAELIHPQIIEYDARWREAHLKKISREPGAIEPVARLNLEDAEKLIASLEARRIEIKKSDDVAGEQDLRQMAIHARSLAELFAKRKALNEGQRAEQAEIAEWLGVWIKTPNLFADWLELRRRSADFRRKFQAGSQNRER